MSRFADAIEYFCGEELPADVFLGKYALRRGGAVVEPTPDEMHRRLAREFARVERQKFAAPLGEEELYGLFEDFAAIIPQGSPMYGIGNPQYATISNCYVVDSPEDSYGSIHVADQHLTQISKRRGGVGLDLSKLRPAGSPTTNSAGTSTGVVTFAKRYSNSVREVGQNGRRGALMLTLSVHHPDVLAFAACKTDRTQVTGANISVRLTNEFMQAVEAGTDYEQRWPVEGVPAVRKRVDARTVWKALIHLAWESAEPGLLFWDHILNESPADCYAKFGFRTISTNPCQPGWAPVLTPAGVRRLADLGPGDAVWSEGGWARVVSVAATGVARVYRYQTSAGALYSTENHPVVRGDRRDEAGAAQAVDALAGPWAGSPVVNDEDVDCGRRAGYLPDGQAVPDRFKYGDVDRATGYLRGLYDVLGTTFRHGFALSPLAEETAEGVQLLLSSLGVRSRLVPGLPWSVTVSSDRRRFTELLGVTEPKWVEGPEDDGVADVLSHRLVGEEEVYSLTVEAPPHTYWTGGLNVGNCGELPLCPNDSCRLLLLNLFSLVRHPFTPQAFFDFDALYQRAQIAQRLMDDMIDLELECIDRILEKIDRDPEPDDVKAVERGLWQDVRRKCAMGRRTGTGITALGDAMAACGVRYGSDESIAFTDRVYRTLKLGCYRASVDLAKELGPFPVWDHELEKDNPFLLRIQDEDPALYADMRRYGRRNIALLTTAPAGTTSIEAGPRPYFGTTSGIEPLFTDEPYMRRKKIAPGSDARVDFVDETGDRWTNFPVFHSKVRMWMDVTGETDYTKSPYHGCCAGDIDWKQRVRLQAAAQRHIDHSISSTLNVPNGATEGQVAEIYETAWRAGCKGVTVYRDGCRDGVLVKQEGPPPSRRVDAAKRPASLPCDVYHVSVRKEPFVVVVGLLDGEPYEVFAFHDEGASLPRSVRSGAVVKRARGQYDLVSPTGERLLSGRETMTGLLEDTEEALTRMVSTALRHGADIHFVVHQLEKTRGGLQSFSKALARALKKYLKDGAAVPGEACGSCGHDALRRQEGCVTCAACGWSKC